MIWLHAATAVNEQHWKFSKIPKEDFERIITSELAKEISKHIAEQYMPIIPIHRNKAYYYEIRFPFFGDAEARECIRDKQELKAYRELAEASTHKAVARHLNDLDMEKLLGK